MEFKDLFNRHAGKDIIVAGCGESLRLLQSYDKSDMIIIGVNDVPLLFTPTYHLIVDNPGKFNSQRTSMIFNTKAEYFLTHLDSWKINDMSKKVMYKLGSTGTGNLLTQDVVDFSNNSPYMGACIAFKFGAKRIGMIGVDFTDNHFYKKDGAHSLIVSHALNTIILHYERLHKVMKDHGVELYNLSPSSKITSIPYFSIDDFIKK